MRTLIWLRNDLRMQDNPALHAAARRGEEGCIAIFVLTPAQWNRHGWGSPKVYFMLDCLRALKLELEEAGIPLIIHSVPHFSDISGTLQYTAERHGCSEIHVNKDIGIDEARRDKQIGSFLSEHDIKFVSHDGNSILPPEVVRTAVGGPFTVFSPYRKKWEIHLHKAGLPEPRPLTVHKKISSSGDPIPPSSS